jgi:uroporphyrinogen decarboxylase
MVPLEYHASPAGSWEHGERLHRLWAAFPHDFGDAAAIPRARPDPKHLDGRGRYRETRRDDWGVVWEQLIFGEMGHPLERPLDDWANLERYRPAPVPATAGPGFEREKAEAERHKERWFLKSGWISVFEVLHAVRNFEDVLVDIETDRPEIHQLADLITERQLGMVEHLLARGVDAVQFGDDFATQTGPMMSPATWRRFFKPRYERLMAPIHAAGRKVFFHTCGRSPELFGEWADLGVAALWPQLNAYDPRELVRFSREARIALALHPDRGDLMVRGNPAAVRAEVLRLAEAFAVKEGGSWFYVEVDSGFPFENVVGLVEAIAELRGVSRSSVGPDHSPAAWR